VRYRWSFGEGEVQVTKEPFVTHDFEGRPQESHYTYLLVRCEAIDKRGQKVVGRDSVVLLNDGFEHLAFKGIVILQTRMTPRFPELNDKGEVRQKVKLWHHLHEPVTIDHVHVQDTYQPPPGGRPKGAPSPQADEVGPVEDPPVGSVLGTSTVPPAGIEPELVLDTHAWDRVFLRSYSLEGHTKEGLPVKGQFSIMRPPAPPTREHNDGMITDPAAVQRIRRTQQILKKEYVNEDEIARMDKLGYFRDLAPPKPQSSSPPPPPQRTPPPPPPPTAVFE
jgi:hypothetical protein